MNNISDFWTRLDLAVISAGRKSFKEVCDNLGLVYQTLINQKCRKAYPSLETSIKLSQELGCSLDWLLTGKGSLDKNLFNKNNQ